MKLVKLIILSLLCCVQAVAQEETNVLSHVVPLTEDTTVYLQPDELPAFPGGMDSLMVYLRKTSNILTLAVNKVYRDV